MTTQTLSSTPSFLQRRILPGVSVAALLVILLMMLSLGLHLYNIGSIGDANAYYTAAVKSMLVSWKNFFFVAAEPGGSVTVDKPPLGLWIEAVFAYFLGVSGFSVSLPNILAGVFGIPLLYGMVKRYMGEGAGLIAALVMTVTPVFVATNRNNTMDGLLVFFLLMAAWAFIQATESGKIHWLLAGAFIVGLGFNIKMMQAFLPLPAFYALYFFGSRENWIHKMVNLGLATILLAAVSLSWAVVVDLVPADSRPFIGSSGNNTVMGLIFGHNGVSRLESAGGPGGNGAPPSGPMAGQPPMQGAQPQDGLRQGAPQQALDACENSVQGDACSFALQNGNTISGSCIIPPNTGQLACAPQGMNPQKGGQLPPQQGMNAGQAPGGAVGGSTQFSQETGDPGVLRFFTQPLSKQMSWLLPFALISLALALFGARITLPLEAGVHKGLILWGGWLMTCVVFFSMISGIFHAYYAIMLAPCLGAMVGIGFVQMWIWGRSAHWPGMLLALAAAVTLGFQLFTLNEYGNSLWWMLPSVLLFAAAWILLFIFKRAAYLAFLASILVIPTYWTFMTAVSNPNINLPTAYGGSAQQGGGMLPDGMQGGAPGSAANADLLAYLEANTQDVEYLAAVPSSQSGASLVIATGRPVLYMGGFGGQDEVVTADDLAAMVANGELRYVMYGGDRGEKQDISAWLRSACSVVPEFAQSESTTGPGGLNQGGVLYLCR